MLLDDIRQLKTGRGDLQKFGLLVGGVFALLGLLFWVRGRAAGPYLLALGTALFLVGLTFPRVLKPLYLGWMSLAFILGFVVSHVILCLFFFGVIAPIGLLSRLFGKDFLRLKLDRQAPTYWIRRERRSPDAPSDYERQF